MTSLTFERRSRRELLELAQRAGLAVDPAASKVELVHLLTAVCPEPDFTTDFPAAPTPVLRSHVAPPEQIATVDVTRPITPVAPVAVPGYRGAEEWHLPAGYGDNKIVLLVRDPHWLFAYWEVSPERRREVEAELAHLAQEAVLSLRVYDVTGVDFDGSNAQSFFDLTLNESADNWYIHVGQPNRSYCVDIGLRTPDGRFYTLARSNQVTTPRDTVSEVIDEEWLTLEETYRYFAGRPGGDSLEIVRALAKRLEWEVGFSGAISSITSFAGVREEARPFWLVLNTELILYGATEPDARLSVQGRPVTLRPDGTFTLRFALPDGEQVIPVTARSAATGQEITITPIVRKETHG